MYCVIMGDIIHSKTIDFQERHADTIAIEKILNQINVKYIDQILAQFGIVRGDAFEGVLFSQQYAPHIIQDIIKSFYRERGLKVRISAVMDELSVVSSDRNKADGPAFHKASYEIEEMKKIGSDHWFQVSIQTNTIAQPLVTSLMSLLSALTAGWTEKQRDIVWTMSDFSGEKKLVSKRLLISKPVVNKQLRAANFDAYQRAWADLEEYFIAAEDELETPSNVNPNYTTYYSIGCRKNKLRDYESAREYFRKAINLATQEQDEKKDINLVPLYNGLAEACLEFYTDEKDTNPEAKESIDEAYKAISQSLQHQKNCPKNPLDFARTLNIQGNYYLEMEEVNLAIKCYEEAKAVIRENYDESHPMIGICNNNLAIAYKMQDDCETALSLYKESIKYFEAHPAENPLSYANALYNIGLCYIDMGEFKEAEQEISHSLQIMVEYLPIKHKHIVEAQAILEQLKMELEQKK